MDTKKVSTILANIKEHVKEAESLGIKCSKRNGKADDLNQKKAISLAAKIGCLFV